MKVDAWRSSRGKEKECGKIPVRQPMTSNRMPLYPRYVCGTIRTQRATIVGDMRLVTTVFLSELPGNI